MESIIKSNNFISINMDTLIEEINIITDDKDDTSIYKPPPNISPNISSDKFSFNSILNENLESASESNILIKFNFDSDLLVDKSISTEKILFESDIFKFKIYQINHSIDKISKKEILDFINKLYDSSYDDFLNENNSIKEISEQYIFPYPIPKIPVLSYFIDKKINEINSMVYDKVSNKIIGIIISKSSSDECIIIPMNFLCKLIKTLLINNKFYIFPYEEELYEIKNLEEPYNNLFCMGINSTRKINYCMLKNKSLIIKINDKILDDNGYIYDESIKIPLCPKTYFMLLSEPNINILYYPYSKNKDNIKYLSYEYSIDTYNSTCADIPFLINPPTYTYKDFEFKIVDIHILDKFNIKIENLNKIIKLESYKDNYIYTFNKLTNQIMFLTKIRRKKITSFDMMVKYLTEISLYPNEINMFNFKNLDMEIIKIKL
jgi:hypothetical protein